MIAGTSNASDCTGNRKGGIAQGDELSHHDFTFQFEIDEQKKNRAIRPSLKGFEGIMLLCHEFLIIAGIIRGASFSVI